MSLFLTERCDREVACICESSLRYQSDTYCLPAEDAVAASQAADEDMRAILDIISEQAKGSKRIKDLQRDLAYEERQQVHRQDRVDS